ncbi:hypothetical protein HPB52_017434 [Rhipicephalus sanguineus]|uniref:CCHC-type domain-containing protein n=1 Tax=Rhipicephalus sanguineus TaxID=34632 RepID=A0A9D4SPZ3_RHISA|nr:hypothetical protein HPB52_017434 [Rhipicephalus sanguineus]
MRAADPNLPPLATEAPRHRENGTRLKNKIIRAGRMPFLPREDTKIVIRPRGGLNIVKVGVTLVADAILAAAGISEEESQQDTLCPNVQQDIMVASTPNQENVSRYINIRQIVVQGKEHEISAYVTAPHSTCKGVIRGIPLQDSPSTINAKIVNEKNPLALMAKRIAQTSTVPNLVKYGSTLLRCTLYRKQIDVCYGCGRLGHRMDVCPNPGDALCRGCGAASPDEHHVCTPKCRLCGGQHLTACKDCAEGASEPVQLPLEANPHVHRIRRTTPNARPLTTTRLGVRPDLAPKAVPENTRGGSQEAVRGGVPGAAVALSRSSSRGRSASGSHRAPGSSQSSTATVTDDSRRRKKPTLSWADKVKGSTASATISNSRKPEQTRHENELEKLRKENKALRATIDCMASEIAEMKNLGLRHAQAPEAMEIAQPVAENSGVAKRRAVDSKHCSEVSEIKSILSQAAVKVLQQSSSQIQVALGDPRRGLTALAERIDRIEQAFPPVGASVAAGDSISTRMNRIIAPPTDVTVTGMLTARQPSEVMNGGICVSNTVLVASIHWVYKPGEESPPFGTIANGLLGRKDRSGRISERGDADFQRHVPVVHEKLEHFNFTEQQQRAVLCSVCRWATYAILRTSCSPATPAETLYADIVSKLTHHFAQIPSATVQRFTFHQRCQQPGESVAEFVADLGRLSEHCELGITLEDMLSDRLVCRVHGESLQRRLLTETALDLNKTYEKAIAADYATRQAETVRGRCRRRPSYIKWLNHRGATSRVVNKSVPRSQEPGGVPIPMVTTMLRAKLALPQEEKLLREEREDLTPHAPQYRP